MRREWRRGAEKVGGRRRGSGGGLRSEGALAADMTERERDPALRQAIFPVKRFG